MPTLLSMAGVEPPEGPQIDGQDISAHLEGAGLERDSVQYWQWNFYLPSISTNAAMRDGDWKLVRPMIEGTRFFNRENFVGDDDVARNAAFVEADRKHKEDPTAITEPLPVPRLKEFEPEPAELYNLAEDPHEGRDLAADQPDRVRRMLGRWETWFEGVEADRRRHAETPGSDLGCA